MIRALCILHGQSAMIPWVPNLMWENPPCSHQLARREFSPDEYYIIPPIKGYHNDYSTKLRVVKNIAISRPAQRYTVY